MPQPSAKCGTNSGYYRHLRRTKTPPCQNCLTAHADATARRTTCTDCQTPCVGERCRTCRATYDASRNQLRERALEDEIAFTGQWRNHRGIWRAA